MRFLSLIPFVALAALVVAHPGEEHEDVVDGAELSRRDLENKARHLQARNCAPQIAAFEAERRAKRNALMKRQTTTSSAAAPHWTAIVNNTCVTAPEVTEGPYYIQNEYVRQDVTETQPGVKLTLDVGVVDTTTCKALPNVFVEIWAANATGFYGGYSSGAKNAIHTETFLRGGYYTNDNGIVELKTIYPGYYTGRTAHIHTMVHKNWQQNTNGTLVSKAGSLVHIGQFFFDEAWNNQVYAISPYTTSKQSRTLNSQDSILTQESGSGNNAFVHLEYAGSALSGGLLGYITLGVNSNKAYSIQNSNSL